MRELNRQDVFNRAYRGLRAQGFRRAVDPYGGCQYNGTGGTHCPVGWAFSVGRAQEDKRVPELEQLLGIREADVRFVCKLQRVHDFSERNGEMEKGLRDFAGWFGLEIPPDDGQDPKLGVTDD